MRGRGACLARGGWGMHGRGACIAGGACVAGGMHGRGSCMTGEGVCMTGGMCSRRCAWWGTWHVWQRDMHGRGHT